MSDNPTGTETETLPDPTGDSEIVKRYYELREHLGFDLTDLDHAFMVTPRILEEAGELVAQADKVENVAKHVWEIVKAEAGERLRANGITTEARIASMLAAEDDVQDARRAYDLAVFEAKVCASLHRALDTQSRLLMKAADMIVAGYLSPTAINAQRRAEIRAARTAADGERRALARPD